MTTYSDTVQQAFRDWNEHRAYVDNGGNYRVRPEAATPTHRPAGKIAPWNREVKRLFPSSAEFHTAARKSLQQAGQGAKTTTKGNDNSAIRQVIETLRATGPSETADAIERSTQPSPDTDEEWYVHKNKREVVNRKGHYIAFTATESDAALIVSDHEAVRKLVAALRFAVTVLQKQNLAGSVYAPVLQQARAALAAAAKERQ